MTTAQATTLRAAVSGTGGIYIAETDGIALSCVYDCQKQLLAAEARYAADKAAEAHDEAMERWLCRYLYRRVKAAQKRKERIEKKVPKS